MDGSSPLLTGEFIGRYVVERELGAGATSTVYLAHDPGHEGLVAIKVLRRELAESLSVGRFLGEIRLTARLQHPHIAPILDSGEQNGRPFCVLPYMEGGTLRTRLDRLRQLPIAEALDIGCGIAKALAFAHSRNIIHRDVKPENILFNGDQACLADFGIAKALEGAASDSSTSTGIVRGTPAYMSPEQAVGERAYDGRTDIYSLGCVLYEMIAGMPAFVGPTPQSVLAQRLTHMPQPLRVYRPQAPIALQRTIERALATNPADRYQTALELEAALEAARTQIVTGLEDPERVSVRAGHMGRGRKALLVAGVVGLAGIGGYFALAPSPRQLFYSTPLDTTRVAVFFVDGTSGAQSGSGSGDLLRNALRRWQDLSVVSSDESADAMRRRGTGAALAPDAWRAMAVELRAGRYILGRLSTTPAGRVITGEYRDARTGLLYSVEIPLPSDSARVAAAYTALVDSLVLRGSSDQSVSDVTDRPRHLFATQALIRGLSARSEWDLTRADSVFARATELDPALTRAHLWLAQVRLWRGLAEARWASSAERAIGDSITLTPTERTMAAALVDLVHHDYTRACDAYRSLIAANPRSFVGWYGVGDCIGRDNVVIRDPRSPSGWRFRSSYYQAILAYTRAFELLPATYHGFQAGGYSRLRELLFTSTRALRRGVSANAGAPDFVARARLMGDTIAMIPFERNRMLAGDPLAVVSPGAVELLRSMFHRIATRWTAAFPNSPDAKEAIAISLELQGDRSALDSIRVAERLATDPLQNLRFAAAGVILQVKFGAPDKVNELAAARHVADSLLGARAEPTIEEAGMLAPLAAMTGRCALAASLLKRWARPLTILQVQIPQDVVGDAYARNAYVTLGCPVPDSAISTLGLGQRIDALVSSDEKRQAVEYYLLGAALDPALRSDSAMITRLAAMGDNVLSAAASALSGDLARARLSLERSAQARRNSMPGDFTPDAAVPEARLWLRVGDTTAAIRILDSTLASAREYAPLGAGGAQNDVALVGSLVHAMTLRALLAPRSDSASARRWSRAAAALLSGADRPLQPTVRKVTLLAQP